MGNQLHLLLMEGKEPIETVMRRICGSYVLWYNKKYDRLGYLFQDRVKSEPVEDDAYFLTVTRYIFHNPLKVGFEIKVQNYIWSNYIDYIEGSNKTDTDFTFDILNTDREKAIISFIKYINMENDDARKIIKNYCKVAHTIDQQKFDINKRLEGKIWLIN